MASKIAVGADHGGYDLKEQISAFLKKKRYVVKDAGVCSRESCDYPEFGYAVAKMVSGGKAVKGIVICRSGIGMSMIANKVKGVRAALCGTVEDAVSSRRHNDSNVLVLGSDRIAAAQALKITEAWLKTRALRGRHARRVRLIEKLERKEFK